jgi:hypothetical protein
MDTDEPNHSTMKRRMKRRFPFLNCKYINDVAYADIMHTTQATGTSHDGYTMALVVCLRDKKIFKVYPMKKKYDAYDMIEKFFVEECVPRRIVTDPAGELTGEEWKKLCRTYRTISKQVETAQQWQDRVERWIGHLKEMVEKFLNKTGAPTRFWSFCSVHCCAVLNHTANLSLAWKTPYEILHGSTPDISVFWALHFWDKVRFLAHEEKFPNNKELPGRFLGVSWEAGNHLSYLIIPEEPSMTYPQVLTRSVVEPDDGTNLRYNLQR